MLRTLRSALAYFNRHFGRVLARLGYRVERDYRFPRSNIQLLRIGIPFLLQQTSGPITIVQIGAYDGVASDPLVGLLDSPRVRAVIVEPQPIPFEKLCARYSGATRVALENSLIGPVDGLGALYVPTGVQHSQLATTSAEQLEKFGYTPSSYAQITVKSMTVVSLLRKYSVQAVDVLQIDAEGADFAILMQFFAAGVEPPVLNLEAFHLQKNDRLRLYNELDSRAYTYIDSNLDLFAVKNTLLLCLEQSNLPVK